MQNTAFNSIPPIVVVASGDGAKLDSSSDSIISSTSSSLVPSLKSNRSTQTPPCRSSRLQTPTNAAVQTNAYLQRKELACAAGEEWATNSDAPTAALMTTTTDNTYKPKNYAEVMCLDANRWAAAMDVEMALHREKGTWELGTLPPGANVMGGRWVYAVKKDGDGRQICDKAR